ncbi:MAG: hypothetical protein O2907_09970 [Proteobacteria bacterium]|nr:hypothetical protein [Pseudomonadota bacterium]
MTVDINNTLRVIPILLLVLAACGGPDASEGRDIGMEQVPERVRGALETKFPIWHPERITESDQGDGVVVYEFFGKDAAGEVARIEIKWAEGHAELLLDERLR